MTYHQQFDSFDTLLERLAAHFYDTDSSGDDDEHHFDGDSSVYHRQDLDREESEGQDGRSYGNRYDSTSEDEDGGSSYHRYYSSTNEDVDQPPDDDEVDEDVDPSFSHYHLQTGSCYEYSEGVEQKSNECDSQGAYEGCTGWEYENSPRSSQYEDAAGWGDEVGGSDYEDYGGCYY